MAVTRLDPGSSTRCPTGQALLSWSVRGTAAADVVVSVVRDEPPGAPAPAVQRTGLTQLLVAAVPVPASVVLQPAAGGDFADGVVVSGELVLRIGGRDAEQYLLPQADVSGTSSTVLLQLAPEGGGLRLAVPADVVPAGLRAPQPAPGEQPAPRGPGVGPTATGTATGTAAGRATATALVQRSEYAARRELGLARLPEPRRTELHVAVDRSASLLPAVRSGAAQALLEVLLGLNTVCGSRAEVVVWELGVPPSRQQALGAATVDGYWERVLGDQATTAGTALAPLVRATARAADARTVVVLTDGVPPDLQELEQAVREQSAASPASRFHLLVLARGLDDPRVDAEPWRDELAPLRPLVDAGLLRVTSVSPEPGDAWLARRLEDPDSLQDLVRSLTSAIGS